MMNNPQENQVITTERAYIMTQNLVYIETAIEALRKITLLKEDTYIDGKVLSSVLGHLSSWARKIYTLIKTV